MSNLQIIDEDTFANDYATLEPDHSFIRALKQSKSHMKRAYDRYHAQIEQKYAEIAEGRAVYRELLAAGRVRPPTRTERLIARANGHEDNDATQAARRLLAKMGIDWRQS